MENLTQNDTGFILWCLGYILGHADDLDEAHKKFIEEGHASVLPKIAELHEILSLHESLSRGTDEK